MSEQDGRQTSILPRPPANADKEAWKAYWRAQGQEWRTEPEIDVVRQKYLDVRRAIKPDFKQGVYPFKDVKLSRADIEWLLATREHGRGPIEWIGGSQLANTSDESQQEPKGIDIRGADLRQVDLSYLPLTLMRGALGVIDWTSALKEQCDLPVTHLEESNLNNAHLEGADLIGVHLEGASLIGADLKFAILYGAHLEGANFSYAHIENATFWQAHLEGANLSKANLENAMLNQSHLERANLEGAHLKGALLARAHLEGSNMSKAHPEEADLENVFLGNEKRISPQLADIHWGDINLAVVEWSQVKILGDEYEALQKKQDGKEKSSLWRLKDYEKAVRANRQLAVMLQGQGLDEVAAHFAYRAQVLQRKVLWLQYQFGRWLFSIFLALLSGYGYRIWRILAAYVVVVSSFALAYFVLGMHYSPHLPLDQAYLESITAFHGRVFLEQFSTNTPQIWLTAFEAITGLVIEGVFIAMLIQRFFGK